MSLLAARARLSWIVGIASIGVLACDGGASNTGVGGGGGGGGGDGPGTTTGATTTTTTVDPNGPWTFSAASIAGLPAVWGGIVAQESKTVSYLIGGVAGTSGPVTHVLVRVEQTDAGVTATEVSSKIAARYCGCALADPSRKEVVIFGGRGAFFTETKTAEVVSTETGESTMIDAPDIVTHPVGCQAIFLPDRDEGYVFGGLGEGIGFSAETWRYSPADKQFTKVDVATGPKGRYDAALRYPSEGGPVWLVGGMGLAGGAPEFYSDVWQFDPEAGSWTEVAPSGEIPQGRRLPWVTFAGDGASLVMGFGSDSAQGATMVDDLSRMDLTTGVWSAVPRAGDVMPGARGFALWLPGPEGSAGILSAGLADLGLAKDAFVVSPPTTDGDWR